MKTYREIPLQGLEVILPRVDYQFMNFGAMGHHRLLQVTAYQQKKVSELPALDDVQCLQNKARI